VTFRKLRRSHASLHPLRPNRAFSLRFRGVVSLLINQSLAVVGISRVDSRHRDKQRRRTLADARSRGKRRTRELSRERQMRATNALPNPLAPPPLPPTDLTSAAERSSAGRSARAERLGRVCSFFPSGILRACPSALRAFVNLAIPLSPSLSFSQSVALRAPGLFSPRHVIWPRARQDERCPRALREPVRSSRRSSRRQSDGSASGGARYKVRRWRTAREAVSHIRYTVHFCPRHRVAAPLRSR